MSLAQQSPPRLHVRTVELRDERPLLAHLPEGAAIAWLRDGEGMAAWGEAARLEAPAESTGGGTARFTDAATWLDAIAAVGDVAERVERPGSGLVAFGSFTFDARSAGSALIVPRVVVGRRDGVTWLTTIGDHARLHPSELTTRREPHRPVGPLHWSEGDTSAAVWGEQVAAAVARIRAGEFAKVVLARETFAEAESAIDPRTVLDRLAAGYPGCYTYAVDGLVGATPELLLRRFGADVTSLVLAGTVARGTTEEEDGRLAAELLDSAKNREEHRYAVESLRAMLGPLCSTIDVPAEPELLTLPNLRHLASPVRATLRPGATTLDVLAAMHPTAAVGGTPTDAAVEAIRDLERMDRGRYSGPVGWIDAHGNAEWGIALRCALIDGARARLLAGGGIVAGSEPAAEIAETESKFQVMRTALTD